MKRKKKSKKTRLYTYRYGRRISKLASYDFPINSFGNGTINSVKNVIQALSGGNHKFEFD